MTRLFLALLLAVLALPLQAGTLRPTQDAQCLLTFDGQIAAGDAEALARHVRPIEPGAAQASSYDQWLCLDSPGGSLAEALRMGAILRAGGVGTRILAGDSCLSACAILFMAGTVYDPSEITNWEISTTFRYPRRMMHRNATLGFHRPSLSLSSDQRFGSEDVERSFDIATEASLELVRLVADDLIAADLVEEMFSHRGEDFFYIDTVGKALRWSIFIDDEVLPRAIDSVAALDICKAMVSIETSYAPADIAYDRAKVEIITTPPDNPEGWVFSVNPEPGQAYAYQCVIGVDRGDPVTLQVCGYYGPRLAKIGSFRCDGIGDVSNIFFSPDGFTSIFALPMDTPLAGMDRAAQVVEARAQAEFATPQRHGVQAFRRRCNAFEGSVAIHGVQNFATLRAAPSLDAPVVSQLPRGGRVLGAEDNVGRMTPLQQGPDPSTCIRLCGSSFVTEVGSRAWQDLETCFDANMFWYPVFDDNFQQGYVSGKFLRY